MHYTFRGQRAIAVNGRGCTDKGVVIAAHCHCKAATTMQQQQRLWSWG
ncbi:hypothetical protein [Stenomitos frigidus]|nr:hypothetical protein [Stenomitos frigidus]